MATKKTTKPKAPKKTKAAPVKKPRASRPKAEAKPKKLSAIDAAAKVLTETGEPMTTLGLINAMAAKGYWTSPGGKTPDRTLYSALAREINVKGKDARFKKADRGKFAANA
jgi:vancomycin resistance protein YoaR